MNRTTYAFRNINYGLINQILNMILPFILKTVLIKKVGAEFLGLSGLFSNLLGLIALVELGFCGATTYVLYKPIADNDQERVGSILNFYKQIYFVVGLIILLVGLAILPFIKFLVRGSIPFGLNIYIVYLFYLANKVLDYILFEQKYLLISVMQRRDLLSKVSIFVQVLYTICSILAIQLFNSYYLFLLLIPMFKMCEKCIVSKIYNKHFKFFTTKHKINDADRKSILNNVAHLSVHRLNSSVKDSLGSIVISAFVGLSQVGLYGVYLSISEAVSSLCSVFLSAIEHGVGISVVKEDPHKNFEEMELIEFFYL